MAQKQNNSKANEITGVVLIGLAALFATSVYFGVQSPFGTFINQCVFGLFGWMGYFFPVILALIGVLYIAAKKKTVHAGKLILLGAILLTVFTMCHLPTTSVLFMEGESYGAFLSDSWQVGVADRTGGGLLGALAAFPMHALLGAAGSWIACVCILVACALALTNLSIKKLSLGLGQAVKTGYRDARARLDERQLEKRDQDRLYVENLNARKAAQRRQAAADPFDLRIQTQNKPKKRKRFSRSASEVSKSPALDLRVFVPEQRDLPATETGRGTSLDFRTIEASERKPEPRTAPLRAPLRGPVIEPRPETAEESAHADAPGTPETQEAEETNSRNPLPALEEEAPALRDDYDPSVYREVFNDMDIELEDEPVLETRGKRRVGFHLLDVGEKPPQPTEELAPPEAGPDYHVQTGTPREGSAAVLAGDEEKAPLKQEGSYVFPPLELLDVTPPHAAASGSAVKENARRLEDTLRSFNIDARVVNILQGPVVTRYELQPAPGIKVKRIVQLADDLALSLAAKSIRIEAPVPGKSVVGIEVPNETREVVGLRELLEDEKYRNMKSPIAFALGKDITGTNVFADISKMPHLLVAGQTGSGKSVCVNSLIVSLLYHSSPDDVRLMMIDPKVVELSVFNNIPHLISPVVTDPKKANLALNWAVAEMENRYRDFAKRNVKELKRYNEVLEEEGEKRLPHVVVIVDELADLMMTSSNEVEEAITRIAQKGRAAGIHLVIATQRPTVNVVTGLIKANVPARVALSVKSSIDSKTILDTVGAEKLLGYGDMLFYTTGLSTPERIQGCWVSDREVERVAEFLYTPAEEIYDAAVQETIENGETPGDDEPEDRDPLFRKAAEIAVDSEGVSTSLLQRRLKLGYSRAARLVDQLEEAGIVSGPRGSKPRETLMTREDLENFF